MNLFLVLILRVGVAVWAVLAIVGGGVGADPTANIQVGVALLVLDLTRRLNLERAQP